MKLSLAIISLVAATVALPIQQTYPPKTPGKIGGFINYPQKLNAKADPMEGVDRNMIPTRE
ncbi:unnamed protein product [Fusarium graminearum]|uniref:Uncharacterized protein n=1 Tax=Gibberella zeae TaxID=5518 RepID=A0A4E9ECB7_GIBZA|nr:unnamed protein product [Fusarium graminearum]CAG1973249.1 unnamed protein product [Fusarium graminearum]